MWGIFKKKDKPHLHTPSPADVDEVLPYNKKCTRCKKMLCLCSDVELAIVFRCPFCGKKLKVDMTDRASEDVLEKGKVA